MTDPHEEREPARTGSLEQTDMGESLRQLWWTIGATVVGLAVIAYFTL
jgi:hypothetical protein